ncbi:hypothetical protein [Streptomyces chartreusis]
MPYLTPTPLPTRAVIASGRKATDPVALRDEKFAYGLEVVLDGLALRLTR